MTTKLRIIFMGTPSFAARILEDVSSWPGGEVIAVYARPDRPAGRGKKLKAPEVKILAQRLNLPVLQPANFKDPATLAELRSLRPDVLVVAAYGLLLPQAVLDIPRLGAYNAHASLLPKLRGAAPAQRALMNGDAITGMTIMKMEAGLDTGPILLQQAIDIRPEDNAGTLLAALAEHGGRLMTGALGMLAEGRAAFIPQDDARATHAPKIGPEDEVIDWSLGAADIVNRVRGLAPEPGAKATLLVEGRDPLPVRIEGAERAEGHSAEAAGTLFAVESAKNAGESGGLLVACGRGEICRITRLRPAGKDSMSARDFANGRLRGVREALEPGAPYGRFA